MEKERGREREGGSYNKTFETYMKRGDHQDIFLINSFLLYIFL